MGEPGTCYLQPDAENDCFPDFVDLTCGCDGTTDTSACFLAWQGTDASVLGNCATPEGTFVCGSVFCTLGDQYCRVAKSDVAGQADGFSCYQMPQSCGAPPDCACLAGEQCGDMCGVSPDGGLILTCPGG